MGPPDAASLHAPQHVGVEPTATALLKLLTFLSPAFPVGAFSCSHGIEWLIDSGAIRTADALQAWLADLVERGGGWNDAVLLAEAHRAAQSNDAERLSSVAELAEALAPSRERRLETMAQGAGFVQAIDAAWPCTCVVRLIQHGGAAYPVAVGAAAGGHGIALDAALPAYLNAFVSNLVSVGVRLIPIGQSAGLRILAALYPVIVAAAVRAAHSSLDDLGSAAMLSDVASMRHETQYSRVFRT